MYFPKLKVYTTEPKFISEPTYLIPNGNTKKKEEEEGGGERFHKKYIRVKFSLKKAFERKMLDFNKKNSRKFKKMEKKNQKMCIINK